MESKIMMILIIGTETIFFLSLMMGFVYFTYAPGSQPQGIHLLSLPSTSVLTGLLMLSSFTLWQAEQSLKSGKPHLLRRWLQVTIGLGVVFLIGQGREYSHLLERQFSVSHGPFATSFFTLTGFHALHVLVGLIMLGILLRLAYLGDFDSPHRAQIRPIGLYWHFVDVVWLVVFTLVYVLPTLLNLNPS